VERTVVRLNGKINSKAKSETNYKAHGEIQRRVDILEALGEFHDIGKITLSSLILDKPGPLDPEEWEEVKLHPEASYKILSSVNAWAGLAETVLAHHEHFDGTGYPKGLRGEEIPLEARILAVADAFDAMTWGRSYKKPISWKEAGEELRRCSGTQFDPRVVEVFLNLLHSGKVLFPESGGERS
jgi:HD-GYP domain-containing protein (c-di-GMP phosphodiesterase class II)